MQKFIMMGRLCGEVEIRTTNTNKMVGNFTVAVNRRFDRDKTDFFRCTVWEKNAENIQKYFGKGDMINIIGRVEIEQGEKDGVKLTYTNVIVEEWNFCGGKKETGDRAEEENPFMDESSSEDDQLPF